MTGTEDTFLDAGDTDNGVTAERDGVSLGRSEYDSTRHLFEPGTAGGGADRGASESSISTLLGAHFLHVSELIDYVWKTPGDLD